MKQVQNVKTITYLGLITAVTLTLSMLVIIPVPATNGLVTLLDAGVYIAGLLFAGIGGGFVGAMTGLLIDLLSGYTIWAPFSFVIHGLQGWVFGYLIHKYGSGRKMIYLSLLIANLIMIIGYAIANFYLYGPGTGWASIPGNILQTGFGSLVLIVFKDQLLSRIQSRLSMNRGDHLGNPHP